MYCYSEDFVKSVIFKRKIRVLERLFAKQKNLYYKSCNYYLYTHLLLNMFIPELAVGLCTIVLDPL
jgi:hypothetical protein